MKDLLKTIRHFEALQKRYMTTHGGKRCDRLDDALEALREYGKRHKESINDSQAT